MSLLVEDWISRANALQRKGRAGRVREGQCYALYTRHRFDEQMRKYQIPEISRVPLEELILQVRVQGVDWWILGLQMWAVWRTPCWCQTCNSGFILLSSHLYCKHLSKSDLAVSRGMSYIEIACHSDTNQQGARLAGRGLYAFMFSTTPAHCSSSPTPTFPYTILLLQIHVMHLGPAATFLSQVLDPPPARAVASSLKALEQVGAIILDNTATASAARGAAEAAVVLAGSSNQKSENVEVLTPLGHHLAVLPTEPRLGKLLVMGACLGCLSPALVSVTRSAVLFC